MKKVLAVLFFTIITSVNFAGMNDNDKSKTDKCHSFVEALVPNGAEKVKKVIQTLY